ncbi:MAG: cbb3-type cytochrome c oxidase subunit I, partial [Phycisphaerales bacterium]|nr:cbb3-type cytochrome c oxidase subunit I [Phycisphaerales bacterium]
MTTLTNSNPNDNYLNHTKGIRSWLFTVDHKRIGIMYLVCVLLAFLLGGIFAMMLRFQLLTPEGTFMTQDQYNQAFTMHGAIMVFLVIIPAIPAALGNFVLPIMLGAKDVAFPKLNLFSWYLWIFGLVFFLIALGTGGLDTGWTFYTP